MRVEIDDLVSFQWFAEETGIEASTLRTWHARNTHGFRDLFDRNDFRPPLARSSKAAVKRWVAWQRAEEAERAKTRAAR